MKMVNFDDVTKENIKNVTTKTTNHPKPPETIRNHPKPSKTIQNHPKPPKTICNNSPKNIRSHRAHLQEARNYTNRSETIHIHIKTRRYHQNYS